MDMTRLIMPSGLLKNGDGQKGLNNGVLILVKSKTAESSGQVQIAQGYGLEGVIPDLRVRSDC